MDPLAEFRRKLQEIAAAAEDDIPLGKQVARRELTIRVAVELADRVLMEGSDGSVEESDYLIAKVAEKFVELALWPRSTKLLAKDLAAKDH